MICYPLTKVSVEFYLLDKDDTTEIKKNQVDIGR